jgi:hypothetical protein
MHQPRKPRQRRRAATVVLGTIIVLAMSAGPGAAQSLFEEVTTLSSAATTVERIFSIPATGSYQLTLIDFGQPANFSSLSLIVTRGLETVTSVDTPGSHTFSAAAGVHEIHVVGVPGSGSSAGIFGVEVLPSGGGAAILEFADTIALSATPNPDLATLEAEFTVTESGTYDVVLADLAFPAALQSVQFNVLTPGGGLAFPAPSPAAPGTYSFSAVPGTHKLLLVAQADAAVSAGLYSVRIAGGSAAAVVYERTHPVAQLEAPVVIDLPAAGSYTLRLTDFAAPAALTQLTAVVVRGAMELSRRVGAGSESFNAADGPVELFLSSTPAAGPGSGTYGADLTSGAALVYSVVRVVNSAAGAAMPGFAFAADVPTSGPLRATLTDFDFPAAFAALTGHVIQSGASLGTVDADVSLDIDAAAGKIFVAVITDPQSATGNSLFGLQLAPPGGGSTLIDVTQGVGSLFEVREVDVTESGSYDATLTDLAFPAPFASLAVAVTRGPERIGSIFGGGTFSFPATPGRYFLNFIAEPTAQAKAGTYGLLVSPTPPAPTVTLSAGATSVGNGGTTTLTWSSTDATSCAASGAWSGSKTTSGTETTAALTSTSTFTLTCSGPGGSAIQSVTVTISAPDPGGGGGGGSLGLAWLLLATAFMMRRLPSRSPEILHGHC